MKSVTVIKRLLLTLNIFKEGICVTTLFSY
jgi:hypothetical protein